MKKLILLACVGAFLCTQETQAGAGRAAATRNRALGTSQAQNQPAQTSALKTLKPAASTSQILSGSTRQTFGTTQSDVSRLLSEAKELSEKLFAMVTDDSDTSSAIVPYTGVPLNTDDLFLPRVSFDTSVKDVDWKEVPNLQIEDDYTLRQRQDVINRQKQIDSYTANTTDRYTTPSDTKYTRPVNEMDKQLYAAQAVQDALKDTGADRKVFNDIRTALKITLIDNNIVNDLSAISPQEATQIVERLFYKDDYVEGWNARGITEEQLAQAEGAFNRFIALSQDQKNSIVETFNQIQERYHNLLENHNDQNDRYQETLE